MAVTTYHNNIRRTGANVEEVILNTSNVRPGTFGKLFERNVDGSIDAQPLYVPNLAIPGQGTHNVIYVATEHNSVYAFDADVPSANVPFWHTILGTPFQNTPFEVGIMATPVIDVGSKTLYVVSKAPDVAFWLHALDLTTGTEKLNDPVKIQASVSGNGAGSWGGAINFDPYFQLQRPGLLFMNDTVYIGFGSTADIQPYHGWLFAYSALTLQRVSVLCLSPDTASAGVWQGGVGLAADEEGNIYVQTGNGPMNADRGGRSFGDSLVKVRTIAGLTIGDYFSPSNQSTAFAPISL